MADPRVSSPQCVSFSDFNPTSSTDLDFTPGFENVVFYILPASIFCMWICIHSLWSRKSKPLLPYSRPWSWKWIMLKEGIILALVGVRLAILTVLATSACLSPPTIAANLLTIVSLIVAAMWICFTPGPRDPTLECYFTILLLADIVRCRTMWLQLPKSYDAVILQTTLVPLDLIVLAMESRRLPDSLKQCLEQRSSLWEQALMIFVLPVLNMGYVCKLTVDHLPRLDARLSSQTAFRELNAAWSKRFNRRHSLLASVIWSSFSSYVAPIAPRLLQSACRLSQPFLLKAMLAFLNDPAAPRAHGAWLVGAYAVVYLTLALTTALYWRLVSRFVVVVRAKIIASIYHKTLTADMTSGDAHSPVTLMGSDVQKIVLSFQQIHEIWAGFLELCIATWLLERELSFAVAVPGAISLVSTVGSLWIAKQATIAQSQWMVKIEARIDASSEFLQGQKAVRLGGLAKRATGLIRTLRAAEIKASALYRKLLVWTIMLGNGPELLSPVATFVLYTAVTSGLGSGHLAQGQAFASLALISLVTFPLNTLVQAGPQLFSSLACFQRIQSYLLVPDHIKDLNIDNTPKENSPLDNEKCQDDSRIIHFKDGQFGWPGRETPILREVNLDIHPGSIVVVRGNIGSGKTALLESILSNTVLHKGTLCSPETMAYCPQTPWLINSTIEQNILMGSSRHQEKYAEAIKSCGLNLVFRTMPLGDKTIVGTNGSQLSGGQKQKISLARALYSETPVVLLDDILSAMDTASVALIVDRVFGSWGILKQRGMTAVIVTNNERILNVSNLQVEIQPDGTLRSTLPVRSEPLELEKTAVKIPQSPEESVPLTTKPTKSLANGTTDYNLGDEKWKTKGKGIYRYYSAATGPWTVALFSLATLCAAAFEYSPALWIQHYTSSGSTTSVPLFTSIYAVFAVLGLAFLLIALFAVLIEMTSNSGIRLHEDLLNTISRAYLPTFMKQDTGVSLNRLSQDLELVDMSLPLATMNAGTAVACCLVQIVLICVSSNYLTATLPAIFILLYVLQRVYLRTSRQLRVLELEARAPLYTHFTGTMTGRTSLRAYGWQQRFICQMNDLLDRSTIPFYGLLCAQYWLNLVLGLTVAALVVLLTGLSVSMKGSTRSGLIGVALNMIMAFNQSLASLLKYWTLMEISLGAVERIKSFKEDTPKELDNGYSAIPECRNPQNTGRIEFINVSASYSASVSDQTLQDVSFDIVPTTHVAICGESGSGKSSLLLALTRLMTIRAGKVMVGGIDCTEISLDGLRSQMNIVPQDPFLWHASIRENLTLQNQDDQTVLQMFQKIGLDKKLVSCGGLDSWYHSESWSSGERQALSVIRALLHGGRIIVFDESTSNMDHEMADRIYCLIREEFKASTILVVLHQLQYAHYFNTVMVMRHGRVVEYDQPSTLLSNESSAFSQLYNQS